MTVVVTYADSAESTAALYAAADECGRRRLPLVVVDLGGAPQPISDVTTRLAAQGHSVDVVHPDEVADTVEEVLRVVAQRQAALLVIGLRHRTPVGKLILGSAAQRLLLDAACPVLAVRPGLRSDEEPQTGL
ncbi:universal stress protein family protein [Branchiibius hedensis]|uniref:Universal stress protein family protein n=1 Tax=Branchiibius hedensis TaxID=672460 RepID=A0A2Y9C125_9MICO|nr:universal stress protein [Branchiibius hedensis]PWJ24726.1 universal stress protein family protein [Branchiibius hedensis]SSA33543.1 Universal stress protein family protein [Branchiibius hedensis]